MERSCPELTDAVDLVESEVSFQYTVETTAFAAVFVNDFEELLLQRVADIVLTCPARAKESQRLLEDEVRVLKLAYPEDRSALSISKFALRRKFLWPCVTSLTCCLSLLYQTPAKLLIPTRNLVGMLKAF